MSRKAHEPDAPSTKQTDAEVEAQWQALLRRLGL